MFIWFRKICLDKKCSSNEAVDSEEEKVDDIHCDNLGDIIK